MHETWPEAETAFRDAIAGHPAESAAVEVFRLVLQRQKTAPDPLLARDCVRLARPVGHPRPGVSRVIYFPTRPGQLPEFFARLAFIVLLARAHSEQSCIAWLAFPAALLGPKNRLEIEEVAATIGSMASAGGLGKAPVGVVFEPQADTITALYLGSGRPAAWDAHEGETDFRKRYGLPLICIPSRSTSEMAISEAAWREPAREG
jgi:hypothetical protein